MDHNHNPEGRPKGAKDVAPRKLRRELTSWTITRLLENVAKYGTLAQAARATGLSPQTVYKLKREDDEMGKEIAAAQEVYFSDVEADAIDWARRGVPVGKWYKGIRVGVEMERSERLMERILEAHLPGYNRELKVDATVRAGVLVVGAVPGTGEEWREKVDAEWRDMAGQPPADPVESD
jgi:hypothetical protein